jgi:Peptidase family M23
MVVVSENHPAYGQMIEIDHGNALITRYAHASKLLVRAGTMVKRGQKIAEVGTSGRSTGPHLHFEVLLSGVQQNPARFLAGKVAAPTLVAEAAPAASKVRTSRRKAAVAAADSTGAFAPPAARDDADAARSAADAQPAAPAPRPAPAPESAGDAAP